MSYRIDYQPTKKVRGMEKRTAPGAAFGALCVLLLLLALSAWPRGARTLRAVFIPGNPAVTVAALEDLAGELKAGESIQKALEGFCRRVTELD